MMRLLIYSFFLFLLIIPNNLSAQDKKISASDEAAVADGYKQIKEAQKIANESGKEKVDDEIAEPNRKEKLDKKNNEQEESKKDIGSNSNEKPSLNSNVEELDSSLRRPLYSSRGKRDPFKPFVKEVSKKEKKVNITKTTPPIKRYSLDEFRIVGIVWVKDDPKAMVIDPEKNTYFLGKNDEIGNRNGVILEIRDNGLLVSEKRFFEDVFGEEKVEIKKSVLAFVEEE